MNKSSYKEKERYSGILMLILLIKIYKLSKEEALRATKKIWRSKEEQLVYIDAVVLVMSYLGESNKQWVVVADEMIFKYIENNKKYIKSSYIS